MKSYRNILIALGFRILIAAPFFAIGWYLIAVTRSGWDSLMTLFFAMVCFIVSAVIVAPQIARLIAEPTGSIYYSRKNYIQSPPNYEVPQILREKSHYEEAMLEYKKIAEQYPEETKPYIEMMDIAIFNLNDHDRAKNIFQKGVSSLQNKEDRDLLKMAYTTLTSDFSNPPR